MRRSASRSPGVSSTSIVGTAHSTKVVDELGCGILNISLNTGDARERMIL